MAEESRAAVFDGARGAAFRVAFLVAERPEGGLRVVNGGGGGSAKTRVRLVAPLVPRAGGQRAADVGEDDGAASRDGGFARGGEALVLLARLVPLEGELDEAPLEIRDVRVATTEDVQRALELRRHQTLRAFQRVSHHALLAEELFLGGKEPTARLGPHLAKRRVRTRVGPENLGTDDVEDVIPGNARRTGGTREVPSLGGRALVRRERGGGVGPTAHPSRRVPGHCDARGTERTFSNATPPAPTDRTDRFVIIVGPLRGHFTGHRLNKSRMHGLKHHPASRAGARRLHTRPRHPFTRPRSPSGACPPTPLSST